jgi:hypothetical protein
MIAGKFAWDQRDELTSLASDPLWHLAGNGPIGRTRVPHPPSVPAHSSAALEAKAHALIERAAMFAAPAIIAAEYRPHFGAVPYLLGVQPY